MSPSSNGRLSKQKAQANPLPIKPQDSTILLALHATRFASTPQLTSLLAISQQATHIRLQRLYHHHYLDHQKWGPRHIYTLGTLGIEYVADAVKLSRKDLRKQQTREVSPYFIDHYLAITDVYVALSVAVRRGGLSLSWRSEVEAADRYELPSGKSRKLNPDGVFTLTAPEYPATLAFLEVDRGTESLHQWSSKLRDYNDYFLSGRITERWPITPRILVLVTTPDLKRAERLRRITADRWKARIGERAIEIGFTIQQALTPERILNLPWATLEESTSFQLIEPAPEGPIATAASREDHTDIAATIEAFSRAVERGDYDDAGVAASGVARLSSACLAALNEAKRAIHLAHEADWSGTLDTIRHLLDTAQQ